MKGYLYAVLCIGFMATPLLSKAQLSASFGANIVSGCSPIVVNFTDSSTGSPTSWSWDLGNGTTSTKQNPSTTYITAGTYTVSLTVKAGASTSKVTKTAFITVLASPVVNFTASDTVAKCPPLAETFTNTSTAGASPTYLWDFGDGTSSTAASPSHTYTNSGSFGVTLFVTNSNGCKSSLTKSSYIKTSNTPIEGFTATNKNACKAPATVVFTNTTTGATSYIWDFGDGSSTDTSTSPSHSYTTTGSYNVTLIATNSIGCTDTFKQNSFVNIGNLNAAFSYTSPTCAGSPVSFTNTSKPLSAPVTWSFGDGTTSTVANPSHSYSTSGSYTVKIVVALSGCADSTSQTITINSDPVVNFSAGSTTSCSIPFSASFTNGTTGASTYTWYFGDGSTSASTSPSHTYNAFGSDSVKLVATSSSGCKDSLTKKNYITITAPGFTVSDSLANACAPATVYFKTTATSLSSYTWYFGDGSSASSTLAPSHTYSSTGSYKVMLVYTTTTGCTDTAFFTVSLYSAPKASFTDSATLGCPGIVTFTNTSTGATSYTWIYGDGATSTSTSPSHYYYQGIYDVTLVASNKGCKDTLVKKSEVKKDSVYGGFYPVIDCKNLLKVSFVNGSTGDSTDYWTFGDGTSSTLRNPTHTYSSYGTYTTVLSVKDTKTGCTGGYIYVLYLLPVKASFTTKDSFACRNQKVTFIASSKASYAKYTWSFSSGSPVTTTVDSVSYSYISSGTYKVTLVVLDVNGCRDTMIKNKYVRVGGPKADFSGTPLSGCAGLNTKFSDSSVDSVGILGRTWSFGDGTTLAGNNKFPSHIYNSAGNYTVQLIVKDSLGCKDTLTDNNYVNIIKPVANFLTSDTVVCPGENVSFTNTSTGTSLTYKWLFGDGTTSTTANPTHTYSKGGLYDVQLITTNGTGCADTLTIKSYIHVNGLNLSFTASDTVTSCPPLPVKFINSTSGLTSFSWAFGNGATSSLDTVSTLYSFVGTYKATLYGRSAGGCSDSISKEIVVHGPRGTLSYSPLLGCKQLTVAFTSLDTNTSSIIWDMNNGYTFSAKASATSTFSYTYTSPGKYVPVIVLSDGASCKIAIKGTDTILVDDIHSDFTFSADSVCGPTLINFTDTAYGTLSGLSSHSWDFGDGTTSSLHNPSHSYTTPGVYTIKLITVNSSGCQDTVTKKITIFSLPVVSGGKDTAVCKGSSIQLMGTGALTYNWFPSVGLTCTTCDTTFASPAKTTTYAVVGTDIHGCNDTAFVRVVVHDLPVVTTDSNLLVCKGSTTTLIGYGAATYTWYPVKGLACATCDTTTDTPATTTNYFVVGKDINGCIDTARITVKVLPLPVIKVDSNQTICKGVSVELTAKGARTYAWSPSSGLTCSSCTNTFASPAATTSYLVTGTDSNGCVDTGRVTIKVNNLPVVSAGLPVSVCTGAGTKLIATGAAKYIWYPGTGLSCTGCDTTFAAPAATISYYVAGIDTNGCTDTASITVTVKPLPIITADSSQTICKNVSVQLFAHGAATYTWSPSSSLSCFNCSSPFATPLITTSYLITGVDTNGCIGTDSLLITVKPLPIISAGPVSVCYGTPAHLRATGAVTYLWSPAADLSSTNTDTTTAYTLVTNTYKVTGTGNNGCIDTGLVIVTVNPLPVLTVTPGTNIKLCSDSSVQLSVTGAYVYIWSPATALSCTHCDSPVANPTNNITYTVTGEDLKGCTDSATVSISIIKHTPTSVGPNDTVCKGNSAQLSATGGTEYEWIPSAGLDNNTIANPVATPNSTTSYTVIIKQGVCFIDTDHVTVVVNPNPTLNLSPNKTIVEGNSVELFASGVYVTTYLWSPSTGLSCDTCPNVVAAPKKTITYTINVSSAGGCKQQGEITVFVNCDNSQLFIPNTFTPNGDGVNDRFYISGKGISTVKRFSVYNRWGELLYDVQGIPINDPKYGWDGTYKGEKLRPDVFVYIINATCETGEPLQFKGDISIVR